MSWLRVGVVAGQRVPVGDEIEAVVLLLQRHPVAERADEVAEMQAAGRPHAGDDARFATSRHWQPGDEQLVRRHDEVVEAAREHQRVEQDEAVRPHAIERRAASARGSRPPSTLPPSSGGIGIMLNTASSTLSCTARLEQRRKRRRDVRLAERHRRHRHARAAASAAATREQRDCSPGRRPRRACSRAADGAAGAR